MEAEKQSVSVSNKPHKDLKCEITERSVEADYEKKIFFYSKLNTGKH